MLKAISTNNLNVMEYIRLNTNMTENNTKRKNRLRTAQSQQSNITQHTQLTDISLLRCSR